MSRWPVWNAWITRTLAGRSDPEEQQLLQRYAIWHVLRRLRRRLGDTTTTYSQISSARQHIRAAITVLDWLARADLTLATANQGDLEAWLASDEATHRRRGGAPCSLGPQGEDDRLGAPRASLGAARRA